MGNLFSWLKPESPKDYTFLEFFSSSDLVSYIQDIKPQRLNYETLANKLKDVNIENNNLIPITIELYERAKEVSDAPSPTPVAKRSMKHICYIKPKFDADTFINDFNAVTEQKALPDIVNYEVKHENKVAYVKSKITIDDFNEAFKQATMNKDMIGVSKKLLSICPDNLKVRMVNSFNQLYTNPELISNISFGKTSFIYKVSSKEPTNTIKAFRQIITIPNAVNHMHRILALRLSDYLLNNNYMDTNIQKGFVNGQKNSIFEQVYKIKSIIKDANKNKKELCIMFIDISNAFPSLKIDRLVYVLQKYNVDNDFITYIQNYYKNFQFYAETYAWKTKLLKWNRGLLQGCPLSPILFITALNYILKHIDSKYNKDCGFSVGNVNLLLTAFADDLCVVTKDITTMKTVFNDLKTCLSSLGLEINPKKCGLMHINPTLSEEIPEIPLIHEYKYLGQILYSDGIISFKQFSSEVWKRCFTIDVKKVSKEEKIKIFNVSCLTWIQKRLLILYDLDLVQKRKISFIVNSFYTKWSVDKKEVELFASVKDIINHSKDEVIEEIDIDDNLLDTFETELMDNHNNSNLKALNLAAYKDAIMADDE